MILSSLPRDIAITWIQQGSEKVISMNASARADPRQSPRRDQAAACANSDPVGTHGARAMAIIRRMRPSHCDALSAVSL
ncbi:unnamed protein product [Victoria cruziana]